MITIVEYKNEHQSGIDQMMQGISLEFTENISPSKTHSTPMLPDAYWVALNNETVVGTVGVVAGSDYAILKRMMVKKEFRGEAVGLSTQLLQTAINWTLSSNISTIYLGTMTQFKVAQGFYTKHGFEQISAQELPCGFDMNPVDSLFFRLVYESPLQKVQYSHKNTKTT